MNDIKADGTIQEGFLLLQEFKNHY